MLHSNRYSHSKNLVRELQMKVNELIDQHHVALIVVFPMCWNAWKCRYHIHWQNYLAYQRMILLLTRLETTALVLACLRRQQWCD